MLATATLEQWEAGIHWYRKAHEEARAMAETYGVSVSAVSGVIAALSPGNPWAKNIRDAKRLLDAVRSGEPVPMIGSYGRRNIDKALSCLEQDPLDVLGGKKVTAFYTAIVKPDHDSVVVVDRHAKGAAISKRGDKATLVRRSEYERIADAYRAVAKRAGLRPLECQAIVWVTWRGNAY